MKKVGIIFLIFIVIISLVAYIYLNFVANSNIAKKENMQFESYYQEEILGSDVATVINKAIDNNKTNEVPMNSDGKYIDNLQNSINIDIKITDDDKVYNMEIFYNNGITTFVAYYGQIKFKCTQIEYHETTKKVKYMLFEQISE